MDVMSKVYVVRVDICTFNFIIIYYNLGYRYATYPLEISLIFQRWWMRISTLCHGLLGGLALGHWLYLVCNFHQQDASFLIHYAYYSDIYVGMFFALCVLCIVSVFDR